MKAGSNIVSIFRQVEDPRSHINQLHNLIDVLLIGIISVFFQINARSIANSLIYMGADRSSGIIKETLKTINSVKQPLTLLFKQPRGK